MFSFKQKPMKIPTAAEALPGRPSPLPTASTHLVNGNALKPPFPAGMETAIFGLGCFWGAERKFWQLPGVYATAVGYAGGPTPNPTYQEVCSGMTGHNEVVLVVFDPRKVSYEALLKTFWESHDPTQGMRQGNDVGTQYRSGIYVTSPEQRRVAEEIAQGVPEGPCTRPVTVRLRPRSSTLRPSTTPRTITSSIWQRIQMVTADSAAPG